MMPAGDPRTVLVVEDDEKIAALLVDYLKANAFAAEHFDNGNEVVPRVRAQEPAAIILDLMLPGMDGMEVCKALRRFSSVPILMLTARVDEIDRLLGLELGADDYVCKPFSPREVMARVKALVRRAEGRVAGEPVAGGFVVDESSQRARIGERTLALTPVEFRLLKVLVDQPGRVFSRDRLLDIIHQDFRDVSDRAIDSHVKNLRRKIEAVAPGLDCIHSVYGVGYRFELTIPP
jgi:two-component system, OmpR family, response regulator BaeR